MFEHKVLANKVIKVVFAIVFVLATCPVLHVQQAFAQPADTSEALGVSEIGNEADASAEQAMEPTAQPAQPAVEQPAEFAEVSLVSDPQADVQATDWEECGTCEWRIDAAGCLTIQPVNGVSGTLSNWENENDGNTPWYSLRQSIVSVNIKQGVSALTTASMFDNCTSLTEVDLSKLNTSNVTNMSRMFRGCKSLAALNLSTINTSKVQNMSGMFFECASLSALNISGFDTSKVTDMSYMFSYCASFRSLDLSGFKTTNAADMHSMFYGCTSLATLNISSFNTSKVENMSNMFHNCSSLNALNLSNFNTSKVTDITGMFYGCSSLGALDLSSLDTSRTTSMYNMFYNCSALTSLNLAGFKTSNVLSMDRMFYGCSSLGTLDLSDLDTSNVTNMYSMFEGCSSLASLDLSSFNTFNVENMNNMFCNCSALTSLDLSSFDTSNAKGTDHMFDTCRSLVELDLSNFNTLNATSMESMFYFCDSLKTLDISNFDTSNVANMSRMFFNCDALESVSLGSGFSFSGSGTTRLCNLPTNTKGGFSGKWQNSATGELYAAYEIPNNVEALYTADTNFMRLCGEVRYDTMSEIVSRGFETSNTVVLASGENFPDALSASALAGVYNAPVVLTNPSALSDQAKTTIDALGAKQVIIMGGEGAISKVVENTLKYLGLETQRVYGQTRQDTSLEALNVVAEQSEIDTVIISSSTGFADSLSASPYSYSKKAPVVLTYGDGTLSEQTVLSIKSTGAKRAIIVGGTGVVKEQAELVLQDAGLLVERWSGNNRYDTSAEIAKHEIEEGMTLDLCAVSSGENFPDALSGGAFVGKNNGILLLAYDGSTQAIDAILGENKDAVGKCYIFGGTAAISNTLKNYIQFVIYE